MEHTKECTFYELTKITEKKMLKYKWEKIKEWKNMQIKTFLLIIRILGRKLGKFTYYINITAPSSPHFNIPTPNIGNSRADC
jgi:hypothetical protein